MCEEVLRQLARFVLQGTFGGELNVLVSPGQGASAACTTQRCGYSPALDLMMSPFRLLSPQLTPAEKGGLSDFSSEPALYF